VSAPRPERIALEPGALAIADLHLDLEDARRTSDFSAWLDALPAAPRLIVLGDLFEFWVGPAHARLPGARAVLAALARAVERGTAVDLVPGNRDFLLDARFERACGARVRAAGLLAEWSPGDARARRALFVHGDELCTLDHGYQRLKRVLRSAPTRALASGLPLAVGRALGRRLRRASQLALEHKPSAQAAQQPAAVAQLCARHGAEWLVCGHAHAWRDERLGGGERWIVLDAFGGPRDALRLDAAGELEPLHSAVLAGPAAAALARGQAGG
jgi:UDP-2,3-diacylglucosamine hydrolase